jgi:hypothetical protein
MIMIGGPAGVVQNIVISEGMTATLGQGVTTVVGTTLGTIKMTNSFGFLLNLVDLGYLASEDIPE